MKPMIALALVALVCLVAAPVASADPPSDPVVPLVGTCIVLAPNNIPPVWVEPSACLPPL